MVKVGFPCINHAIFPVMNFTHKVVIDQKNRDDKMNRLVKSMDDILGFLLEAEVLNNIQSSEASSIPRMQIKNLQLIAVQITECAYFISEYSKDKNIGKIC